MFRGRHCRDASSPLYWFSEHLVPNTAGALVSVLYIVLPVGLALSALALIGCVRAIKSGQFDDLETPAHRILLEEDGI